MVLQRRHRQRPHVGRGQLDLDTHSVQRSPDGGQNAAHEGQSLVGVLGQIGDGLLVDVVRVFPLGLGQRLLRGPVALGGHAAHLLGQIGEAGIADEIA